MAGGTFLTMNKRRPGAYINFESVPKPLSSVGERGIMTMPVPLTWGAEKGIIELFSSDLLDGRSINKIGLSAMDPESLIFRQALSGAYLAYVYRIDTGATKATATIGDLTVAAKYAGTTGNRLEVAIIEAETGIFTVVTFLDSKEVARQEGITAIADLVGNDWVDFDGDGDIAENAGTKLAGATDGTVNLDTYTDYFAAIKGYKPWNTMAIPNSDAALPPLVAALIEDLRENVGRKVQAVVVDYPEADYEGIISVNQGYKTPTEEITPEIFAAYVAGITAGAAINESNTYKVIKGASEIINPVDDSDVPDLLRTGHLLLTRKQDGAITIEQDINTFTNFQPDKGYEFCKNRVIRVIDGYGNDIRTLFENNYIGKVDNNELGRNIFKADVIAYLTTLQSIGAIQNFDSSTDITISTGDKIDEVVLDLWIQPVDSMEKLYNRVYLGEKTE